LFVRFAHNGGIERLHKGENSAGAGVALQLIPAVSAFAPHTAYASQSERHFDTSQITRYIKIEQFCTFLPLRKPQYKATMYENT